MCRVCACVCGFVHLRVCGQELETSEEMLRSCRQKLLQEVAAKEAAQLDAMECKRVIQAKEEDSEALKTEQLRLHKELDILRAQIIENDRQHEEEVVRLRTGMPPPAGTHTPSHARS